MAPRQAPTQATIRVFVKPLILWLWIGGAVMAIGTLLAAFPGRRGGGPPTPCRRRSSSTAIEPELERV